METMTMVATLAGTLTGIGIAWACWWIFGEWAGGDEGKGVGARRVGEGERMAGDGGRREGEGMVALEPEVTQEDVRSFFAKYDAAERNVPVAMIAEWKQLAAEKMAAVHSAEEFAFEQGRLAAFCEMEKAFLEVAEEMRAETPEIEDEDGEKEEDR